MRQTTRIAAYRAKSPEPVSGERDAWYERPARDSLVLERFFDSRIALARVCPETALMYAVLEDALLCFHRKATTQTRFSDRTLTAEEWFFSDESGWFYSFLSICQVLGLEPQDIRNKLSQWSRSHLDLASAKR